MPKYQVQYKNNTKTFNHNFEANSHIEIIDFFQDIINAELTEIREVLYEDNFYPKDDGDYIKSVSCLIMSNNEGIYSFKIPKMKKGIDINELKSYIQSFIKINNKVPKSFKITENL